MVNRRLLCITAHPDDEAGNFGGSLIYYHGRGVETYVVCLTPGQAATHRGGYMGERELAAVRREEFAASCRMLKVTEGEVLDYPDGSLDRIDLYAAVGELVARVRRIRPQVMLTFGPEGAVTAHPDHSMASICATLAFHWAGRSNRYVDQLRDGLRPHRAQKLYYSTYSFTLPDREPVSLPPQTALIQIGDLMEVKIAAFKQHQTQAPLFPLLEGHVRRQGGVEAFHLTATSNPELLRQESDLFEGVEDGQ